MKYRFSLPGNGRLTVFAAAVLLLLLAGCSGIESADEAITMEDGWVRAMPPGSRMTAGYGTLHNNSDQTLTLAAFSSPQFGMVELHETRIESGTSRMRQLEQVSIPPGESLLLEPGGKHLMLMQASGQTGNAAVTIQVTTRDAGEFVFELPARSF